MEDNIELAVDDLTPSTRGRKKSVATTPEESSVSSKVEQPKEKQLVSCLTNKRVIVRFVPKQDGRITDKNHVLYGGMAENSVRGFTVPIYSSSGAYKNVLTNSEKDFLEDIMGLEDNALSIYKTVDNYWENFVVRLTKQDTILDLSNPNDYIKYKVLKANDDYIADSLETLQDKPKATYEFVLINENDEAKAGEAKMSILMKCYKEFGKIENDTDKMRVIFELIRKRPLSANTKMEFLKNAINTLIQDDPRIFYNTITDELLSAKVLVKKAVEAGIIARRGDQYFLRDGNLPLCGNNEDPTLSNAARYLSSPRNQDLRFKIEAKV